MSKKETLSKAELQKMTGLDFSEQNSQAEESRKKSIDAALENFSIENIKPHPLPSELKQAQRKQHLPLQRMLMKFHLPMLPRKSHQPQPSNAE